MERPLWSGTLAFGIVSIPVRLTAAVREHDLHFHQISRTDRKRIRYKKVAEGSDEEVPAEDIVKGFAVKPGAYVVFADDELAQIAARKSRIIELERFVDLADIDPLYFDRPYLLVPGEQADKPYRLLTEALQRSGRTGIAQFVMHGKEHVAAVRAIGRRLYLHTLRFADEVLKPDTRAPAAALSTRELAMAERLVESLHGPFDPSAFHDEYRKRLQAAIARKARGKTIAIEEEPAEAEPGKVISLLDALERSLAAKRRGGGGPGRQRKATRRRAG